MKAVLNKFTILILCVLPLFSFAQKQVETEQFLWTRYNLKLKISNSYDLKQELASRFSWLPLEQSQYFSRTHFGKNLGGNWKTGIGFTYPVKPDHYYSQDNSTASRGEIRPQIELSYSHNILEKLTLNHRYWCEFRFFEQYDEAFKFRNFRFRYKLELRYALSDNIMVKAFDELFINIGNQIVQNTFDQNRYGFSVNYSPFRNFGFELGYLNIFQQRSSGTNFNNHHILRVTLHHTINFTR